MNFLQLQCPPWMPFTFLVQDAAWISSTLSGKLLASLALPRHPQVAPVFRTRGKKPWTWNEPRASSASVWPDVPPPRSLKNNGQNSTKSPKNIEKAALIHSYDKFNCVVYACKPYPILPRIFLVIVMTWQPQKRRLQKSSCENSDECWEARKATAKTTAMNFVHYSINSCQNLERKWP